MKFLNSSLFRAICTLIVGVLLIMYPNEAKQGLIIAIGLLFILPGLATVIVYYITKNEEAKKIAEGVEQTPHPARPMFPLAGWGSLLLGIGIIIMKDTFITFLPIILSTILVLLAIASFITLVRTSKYWHVGIGNFVMPVVVFVVGALIIFDVFGSAVPLPTIQIILGLAFIFYGLVEIYYFIRIMRGQYIYKKQLASRQKAQEEQAQIEETLKDVQAELDAEIVEAEEVPTEEKKDIFD